MMRNLSVVLLSLGLLMGKLHAHPSPHSNLALEMKKDRVEAFLHLPIEQLRIAFPDPYARSSELPAYIAQHLRVTTPDGVPFTVEVKPAVILANPNGPEDLQEDMIFTPPPGRSPRQFILESDVIQHHVISHRMFVTLRSDWETAVFSDHAKLLTVLHSLQKSHTVDLSHGSVWQGFKGTFVIGVRHIAEGTDHLLFLLMLMLPAGLLVRRGSWGRFRGFRESFVQLAKIVTAFTIGHSLTLAVGSLHWFYPHVALVESLIAVSIFISALHAIWPLFPNREFWVAGGFGLIHGLAFSTVVAEFNLGTRELLLSILGFNLGIEAMQLAIVSCLVPLLLMLAQAAWYRWVRYALAGFGAVAALGWLGERALGLRNPMEPVVDYAVQHVGVAVAGLAVLVVGQRLIQRWANAAQNKSF